MAVGGLPSKRQGRLGRPKDHRHPPVMDPFILFSSLTLLFTFFPLHPSPPSSPSSSPRPSPSRPTLPAPSPSPPSPAPSPPPPPTPSPTPSPSQLPFPLLFTTSCETSHRLRLFGATPRDQARYPPTRIRPCHSGLSPPLGHVIGPIRSFSRPTLDNIWVVGTAVMA
jgi:hypothetical protein